jgi:hypothetical protein
MTIEAISFIIGGILIGTAIIGGGFEIKEIKMPHVGAGPRFFSLIVGSFFILIGLGMWELQQVNPSDSQAAVSALAPGGTPPVETVAPASPANTGPAAAEVTQVATEQVLPDLETEPATDFTGIHGRMQLTWNIEGYGYSAFMETAGQVGVVRVTYLDETGQEVQVDQDLVLYQDANLRAYQGMDPRYAGTGTPHPSYAPDIFRLVELQSGRWSITEVCDTRYACAPVSMEVLP